MRPPVAFVENFVELVEGRNFVLTGLKPGAFSDDDYDAFGGATEMLNNGMPSTPRGCSAKCFVFLNRRQRRERRT